MKIERSRLARARQQDHVSAMLGACPKVRPTNYDTVVDALPFMGARHAVIGDEENGGDDQRQKESGTPGTRERK
jgi:hypothetical protein